MITSKVYKHYRLGRISGNAYSKDVKKFQRDVIITPDIAEEYNANTMSSGDLFELDEEATETFLKQRNAQLDAVDFKRSQKIKDAKQTLGEVFEKVAAESLNKDIQEKQTKTK